MSPSHAKRFLRRMTVHRVRREDADLVAAVAAERGLEVHRSERQTPDGRNRFEVVVIFPKQAGDDLLWAARMAFRRAVIRREQEADG